MQSILECVFNGRLTNVIGMPGIGKTSIVKFLG